MCSGESCSLPFGGTGRGKRYASSSPALRLPAVIFDSRNRRPRERLNATIQDFELPAAAGNATDPTTSEGGTDLGYEGTYLNVYLGQTRLVALS